MPQPQPTFIIFIYLFITDPNFKVQEYESVLFIKRKCLS